MKYKKTIITSVIVLLLSGIQIVSAVPPYTLMQTIIPSTNNTYDLGTSTKVWANIYGGIYHGDGSLLTGISSDSFTTTTINGVSSTSFTLTSSTYLGITNVGSNFTFTNLGITSNSGNWAGTVQGKTLGSIATFLSTDYLTSSTAYVATSTGDWLGTWQTHSPAYFQTALGYTPLDTAGSNYMTAPLVVGGVATSTITGDGSVSTIGGDTLIKGTIAANAVNFNGLAGNSYIVYDAGSNKLEISGENSTTTIDLTSTGFDAKLDTFSLMNADRTFTFPDQSGTFALTSDLSNYAPSSTISSQWTTTSTGIFYNGGNVGIGTTGPTDKLVIDGGTNKGKYNFNVIGADAVLKIYRWSGVSSNYYPWYLSTGMGAAGSDFAIQTGSSTTVGGESVSPVLYIKNSGNVGIGTTTPATALVVVGTSTTDNAKINTNLTIGSKIIYPDTSIQSTGYKILAGASIIAPTSTSNPIVIGRPYTTSTAIEAWCQTTGSNININFKNNGTAFATTTATQAGNTSSSLSVSIANKQNITISILSMTLYDTTSTLSCAVYGTQ